MKKLVFVALVAFGAMHAGGCIITSGDDDGPIEGEGFFDVTWSLDPGCPAGGTTAQVLSQEVDASGNPIGSATEDLFNCSDGGGTTAALFLGDYDVTVNITDDSTNTLFAQSNVAEAALITDLATVGVSFAFPTEEGFFGLTWTLDGVDPTPADCADAGSGGVAVLATLVGTAEATDDIFDCDAGEGVTSEVPIGDHQIEVALIDENEAAIDPVPSFTASIEFGNEIADLGDFDLSSNP